MAVLKHSSIVAASSGKVGGNIFSRNKSGMTVRCARNSVNIQTSKSVSRRNFLRQIGVLWRTTISNIILNNLLVDSFFRNIDADWVKYRCSVSYFPTYTQFNCNPLVSFFTIYQELKVKPNTRVYVVFRLLASLSSNISKINILAYQKNAPTTALNIDFFPPFDDDPIGVYFDYSSTSTFFYFRITGINSIACFEYAFMYTLENSFLQNWNQSAKNFPYSDRLGDSRVLSGQQLFTQLSLNLKELGLDPVLAAPVPSLLGPLELLPGTGTSDSLVINSNQFPLHSDCAVLIFATRTFPKSVTSWKPQEMKQLRPTPVITTSSINVFSQYVSIYGASSLIVGGHVFIKVSYFDKRTGQKVNSVTQSINIV